MVLNSLYSKQHSDCPANNAHVDGQLQWEINMILSQKSIETGLLKIFKPQQTQLT